MAQTSVDHPGTGRAAVLPRAEGTRSPSRLDSLVFGAQAADPRQRLRMVRYLMASASSLLVIGLYAAGYLFGFLPLHALASASGFVLLFVTLFFMVFRSGLNLRFHDASLTLPQILASVF